MVELTVLGIASPAADSLPLPLLLLHAPEGDRVLVMHIGPMEAAAIIAAQRKKAAGVGPRAPGALFPRPQTHDLLLAAISGLRGKVICIDIQNHIEGAFIAEAVIDYPLGRLRLDCRPSDGIALALRCGALVRASSAVLTQAVDSAAALGALTEEDRRLMEAKLEESRAGGARSGHVPESVKQALQARERVIDPEARQRIISVARKMLTDEGREAKSADAPEQGADAPRSVAAAVLPTVRVSLVRQKKGGETEIMEEYQVPAEGLSREIAAGLGISGREAAALNAASDEERWAILLKMLMPETKVPM